MAFERCFSQRFLFAQRDSQYLDVSLINLFEFYFPIELWDFEFLLDFSGIWSGLWYFWGWRWWVWRRRWASRMSSPHFSGKFLIFYSKYFRWLINYFLNISSSHTSRHFRLILVVNKYNWICREGSDGWLLTTKMMTQSNGSQAFFSVSVPPFFL